MPMMSSFFDFAENWSGSQQSETAYGGWSARHRIAWAYDARCRLTAESRVINGTGGVTASYTYDGRACPEPSA